MGLDFEHRHTGYGNLGSSLRAAAQRHEQAVRMGSLIVISWRDIPAQVIAKRGREAAKVPLSHRFQEAVDRAAMRAGKGSSDAYLADWQRSAPRPCGEDLEAEAAAEAARLEAKFTDEELERLIRSKGLDENRSPDPGAAPPPSHPDVRLRLWSVRHARGLNAFYRGFEALLLRLHGLFRAFGYERIERPVAAVRSARQGPAVRLPHVRPVRSQLHRHVLPDELSRRACAMAPAAACATTAMRSQAGDALRLGRGLRGSRAHTRRHRGDGELQIAVDQRLQGRSSWLKVVREKARCDP